MRKIANPAFDVRNRRETTVSLAVQDLEAGTLVPEECKQGKGLNMPALIMDYDRLLEILFQAWEKVRI